MNIGKDELDDDEEGVSGVLEPTHEADDGDVLDVDVDKDSRWDWDSESDLRAEQIQGQEMSLNLVLAQGCWKWRPLLLLLSERPCHWDILAIYTKVL